MATNQQHIYPWWLGYLLLNPLRKFIHNPDKILKSFIKPGMKVLDYGSAMGYFSLPLARMTGNDGKVYCFDIQENMLDSLKRRADKAGLRYIIEPRLISNNTDISDLSGKIDFALLFAMVHEVPDKKDLFKNLNLLLKTGGIVLFAEPRGHVSKTAFENSLDLALSQGFEEVKKIEVNGSHAVVLKTVLKK